VEYELIEPTQYVVWGRGKKLHIVMGGRGSHLLTECGRQAYLSAGLYTTLYPTDDNEMCTQCERMVSRE